MALKQIYKRLDLLIGNEETSPEDVLKIMPEEKVQELKILYWCIKEIYFSPHRAFLYSLSIDRLNFRFLKAKKYCSLNNPYKFMNYFIKCLQDDFYAQNEKEG